MKIQEIADAIPCNYAKCCKHLENCIDKGVFGENAYLISRTGTWWYAAHRPLRSLPPRQPQSPAGRSKGGGQLCPDSEPAAGLE